MLKLSKYIIVLGGVVSIISCKSSQGISSNKNKNTAVNLREYLNTITATELKEHLTIIASDDMQGRETGSQGQKKAGNYLVEQYKKFGIPAPTKLGSYYQTVPAAFLNAKKNEGLPDSENIMAFIEGIEKPNEIVVLSAHYDHVGVKNGEVYNGADDDGSGTVALIEIAQALQKAKKEGRGPKRSVLILHVTGEEHGLHGSRYYSENPVYELSNTVADINIDMIGRRDNFHQNSNDYIYLIGSDYLSSELYQVCEDMNKKYINTTIDYKYNDKKDPNKFYYRSDHYNFAKHNIPSVFLFNGTHEDYHKPTDDVDKIEFDALEKRTKFALAIVWEIANRPEKLKVDKLTTDKN